MAVSLRVSSSPRRAGTGALGLLVAVALLCVLPGLARAASSPVRTTTVRFESHGEDGYEWATYSVRYALHTCDGGDILLTTEFVRGSLRFSPRYVFEGQHFDAPVDAAPNDDQASIAGDVIRPGGVSIGSFSDTASQQSGHGCLGVTVPIANVHDYLGDKPSQAELQSFVNSLDLRLRTLPPYRNQTIESGIRQKRREAARAAEQKAAAEKAAAEKATAEKATAEKATAEKAQEQEATGSAATQSGAARRSSDPASGTSSPSAEASPEGTGAAPPSQAEQAQDDAYEEGGRQLSSLAQQLMRAQEERDDREFEREMARQAAWRDHCTSIDAVAIGNPTYFVPPGRAFTKDSQFCYRGEYYSESRSLTDAYTFTVHKTKRLRFFLATELPDVVLSLRHDGTGEEIANGTQFVQTLAPGAYVVRVDLEQVGTIITEDHYYLRILGEDRCWTTDASPIRVGVNQVDRSRRPCRGPDGQPAQVLKLEEPSSGGLRNLKFTLRTGSPARRGARQPSMTLLGGDEGRVLNVAYERTATSVIASVNDARPERYYVIVGSSPERDNADAELRVGSEPVPYTPHFRGDFSFGAGTMFTEHGTSWPLVANLGFSLGAQISRLVGVSGVASGSIGGGSQKRADGSSTRETLIVSGLFGPGVHFGTPRTLVRLIPAVSVMKWTGDATVGPALRIEGFTADATQADTPFRNMGLGLYAEARRHDGVNLFGFGFTYKILPSRRIPPPDDQ